MNIVAISWQDVAFGSKQGLARPAGVRKYNTEGGTAEG